MNNLPAPPSVQPRPRVLVFGATSLIGRYLLARLMAAGAHGWALSRAPPCDSEAPAPGGLDWAQADLSQPQRLEALGPADVVLSLSPIWLLPPALPPLARLGVRRVVAFSSTSRLTKAQSPVAAERAVAERLAEGELLTERACEAAGIAWTLLRPTLIYAERRDHNVSRLARLIERVGFLPLSGAGAGLRQPVHADDLAQAAVAVLDRPQTFGRSYNLPGGETLSYRAMAERVFEGLGRRPRILTVPPWAWRVGLRLASPLLPGVTTAMGRRMGADLVFDPQDARRDFGWSPRPFRPEFRW